MTIREVKPANMRDDMVSLKVETVYDAVGKIVDKYYLTARTVKDVYCSDLEAIKSLCGQIMNLEVTEDIVNSTFESLTDSEMTAIKKANTTASATELSALYNAKLLEKKKTKAYENAVAKAENCINSIAQIAAKDNSQDSSSTNTAVVALATKYAAINKSIASSSIASTHTDNDKKLADYISRSGKIAGIAFAGISELSSILETQVQPVIVNDLWSIKDEKIEFFRKENNELKSLNSILKDNSAKARLDNNTLTKQLIEKDADYRVANSLKETVENSYQTSLNGLKTTLDTLNSDNGVFKALQTSLTSQTTALDNIAKTFQNQADKYEQTATILQEIIPVYSVVHLTSVDGNGNIFEDYETKYRETV